jgi:hypothetical protein
VEADLCSGQTAGLTDWPIERIVQTVEPDDAQRAILDELKDATAKALDILKAADRARKMPPPMRVEEAALEGRARECARARIAGGSQVGESLIAQHAAGKSARVARRSGAGRRRRDSAAHLILLNDTLLWNCVLLCRRRSVAARLILLNHAFLILLSHALLRSNVLLWRGVAAAAP